MSRSTESARDQTENLRHLQQVFTYKFARLVAYAYRMGYLMTYGHAWRCEGCPASSKPRLHELRLAVDLNLFRREQPDVLLTRTEDHEVLGRYWEQIGGTWGGRFGDGNHYSMTYRGMK